MYSSGRFSLICVTVFALVMTGLLVGATDALAQGRSETTLSFYTSFGRNTATPTYVGGPYILGVVWDPTGDSGDGELRVIFNEDLEATSIEDPDAGNENYDFRAHGFDWAAGGPFGAAMPSEVELLDIPSAADQRVIALRGFSAANPPGANDSLSLRTVAAFLADYPDSGFTAADWTGGVAGDDGDVVSLDHSVIPIRTGPQVVSVTMSNDWYTTPMTEGALEALTLYLEFDDDIVEPTAPLADSSLFKLTAEMLQISEEVDIALNVDPADQNILEVTWATVGASSEHWRWFLPGQSMYLLGAGAVEDSTSGNTNAALQRVMFENEGPVVLGATLDNNNNLWVIFNETIDPGSFTADPTGDYNITDGGGGAAWGAAPNQVLGFNEDFTNVIKIEDAYNAIGNWNAADALTILAAGPEDFQSLAPTTAAGAVAIGQGIAIIRASYDMKGTPTDYTDDELIIVFSETFATNPDPTTDIEFIPSDWNAILADADLSYTTGGTGPHGVLTIDNFDQYEAINNERMPLGMGVKLTPGAGVLGTSTGGNGDPVYDELVIPIVEDRVDWAATTAVEVSTTKFYTTAGPGYDEAYITWRDASGFTSDDEWLIFYTNQLGTLNQSFINDYADAAVPAGTYHPQSASTTHYHSKHLDIAAGTTTTDGQVLADGDEVSVMIVPATYRGSIAPFGSALVLGAPFIVGPPCPPVDSNQWDDNKIHVAATLLSPGLRSYTITGDSGSAPCGDSVVVYNDETLVAAANIIGRGVINTSDRSFGPITLTTQTPDSVVWLRSKTTEGSVSDQGGASTVPIIIDKSGPTAYLNAGGGTLVEFADRFNPYQMYTQNDYINFLVKIFDGSPIVGSIAEDEALSDLLTLNADFTMADYRAVAGTDSVNAIPFVALGADSTDNDGDWDDTSPNAGNGNGIMDFPEPYKDEDGNGWYTSGEEFIDRNGNGLCDAPRDAAGATDPADLVYDWNLDSTDPDEHGWYEIRLTATEGDLAGTWAAGDADSADVVKGFRLVDPISDPTGQQHLGTRFGVPVYLQVADAMLDTTVVYNGVNAGEDPVFLMKIDEAVPTVSKITTIQRPSGLGVDPAGFDNIYQDTDPIYNIGRYLHIEAETPSDIDVLYGVVQVETNRTGGTAWEILSVDPPGANGDAAGYPGLQGIDDDDDGLADSADVEVLAALTDSEADGIDNDGDAYFTFEPYYDGGANVYQRVIWHNIDEAGEQYDIDDDENEDGLSGSATIPGEAVQVDCDGAFVVYDSAGVGVPATIYVPAATVLGAQRGVGPDDLFPMTEITDRAYGILDGTYTAVGTSNTWGDSTAAGQELRWYHMHPTAAFPLGTNIDWQYLVQYYGMSADGETPYRLRVVPYDQTGLSDPDYAYPMTFTLDLTAPDQLAITDCRDGIPETGPPDFVDVKPADAGLQIYDTGTYTLTVEDVGDAVSVLFDWRYSDDNGLTWTTWRDLKDDTTAPFSYDFSADDSVTLGNVPPDQSWLCQFRAVGTDEFGNATDPDSICVFEVEVIDGDPPCTWFTKIWTKENLTAAVAGCDSAFWYRDVYGPVQVPVGPTIDVWASFDEEDVIRVVFEYRPVGAGGEWTAFATQTGLVRPDSTIDLTKPVAVTLDTETLGTGSFDIRVYACDIEGNCNLVTADMATLTIIEGGLRAYIEDPVAGGGPDERTLYAFNYIHDADIDYVTFQYSDDDGMTWTDIDVAGGTGGTRGDVLILRGTNTTYDDLAGLADPDQVFDAKESYWDADEDGLYSSRDPILWDENDDQVYNPADGDSVILGDMSGAPATPAIVDLAAASGYYHTDDVSDNGLYDIGEWIFQDNGMEAVDNLLDLWTVAWDVSTLSGTYWVRSVATDEFGATDDGSTSPIPYVIYMIDVSPPDLAITQIRYMEDGTLTTLVPGTDTLEVAGVTKWLELLAETSDADIDSVLFQWSTDGGTNWTDIDPNDDNDYYADLVRNDTFDEGLDEIIRDVDGDYVYDAGTDIVLSDGDNNVVDTPDGYALMPLVGEDPDSNALDDDNDGVINEDDDDVRGDRDAPYLIHFVDIDFLSDTNVQFRTMAWDIEGNQDSSEVVTVLIGETEGPLTDVITVTTAAGTEVDVWQPASDGDEVDLLGERTTDLTLEIFVTAEDGTEITSMDLMWRWHADCNTSLDPWDNNWESMSDAGWTTLDTGYDYLFTLDLAQMAADVGDGTIEFFPMGTDGNGNTTTPPVNPYSIRFLTNRAMITAASADTAVVDQEVWFTAELDAANDEAAVLFYRAARVMEEEIDVTRISSSWPYRTLSLQQTLFEGGGIMADDHVLFNINGVDTTGTYYASEAELLAATGTTMYDWTYNAGTNTITFGAPPAGSDEIMISYNVATYSLIGMDNTAPYTAMFDVTDPAPGSAFDILALVAYGDPADLTCYAVEPWASEQWFLPVKSTEGPTMFLYAGGAGALEPDNTHWPGNSSAYTQDQYGQGTQEWKLSGIEAEVFAEVDQNGPLSTVALLLTDPMGVELDPIPMAQYTATHTHVPMTFTLYEEDFPQVDYGFENVTLNIDEDRDGTVDETYAMTQFTDYGTYWQISDVPILVNNVTWYDFTIDVNGNNYGTVDDPRNVTGGISSVNVPATPFFYVELDLETLLGTETGVCELSAVATNAAGEVGTYPPVLFVYDPEAPLIDALEATDERFNENVDVTLYATITDPHTFNAVTVEQVLFEYCPNYSDPAMGEHVWLPVPGANLAAGYDTDRTDGWAAEDFNIPDPEADGYDNDGNGLVDEEAEGTVEMAIRVFAMDDGYNYGAPAQWIFTLDSTEPAARLIQPINGTVYTYESTITLEAVIDEQQADLNRVMFQFDVGSGWPVGAYTPGAEGWVDATPEDNSDDPWLLEGQTNASGNYEVTFYIPHYQEWIDEYDTYIRFRAVARDNATNEDGDPTEVLVLMDDINAPTAWLTDIKSTGVADFRMFMDPHTAIQGDGVDIRGTVADPEDWTNIATVEIEYYNAATEAWTLIDVLQPADLTALPGDVRMATFAGLNNLWDVTGLDPADYPDGIRLRARATDRDGNTIEPPEEPAEVTVVLDLVVPDVYYQAMGPYEGFTTYAEYENDGGAGDDPSRVLLPNEHSLDLYFTVVTTASDLEGVTLEWRYHTDGIGAWRTWPGGGAMDYEPNLTFEEGGTTYYVWRLRTANFVDAWTGAGLNGGRCDIRALCQDYAGNSNYLFDDNNPWETWTVDVDDPLTPAVDDWADDLVEHQVAAGGTVHLQVELRDAVPDSANTDIVAAYFEYQRPGDPQWYLIEDPEGVTLTPYQLDTNFAYWLAEVDWTTPTDVYWDEDMNVRVTYWDAAGNSPAPAQWATAITVEDLIKPDMSLVTMVPAELKWVNDPLGTNAYERDCDATNNVQDGLFYDVNLNNQYDTGVDIPVDFGRDAGGSSYRLVNGAGAYLADSIGAEENTFPRWVDYNVLYGQHEVVVSNDVTLVGRTQDPDQGIEYVEFWAMNEATEEVLLIGVDDCTPAWDSLRVQGVGPLWHWVWNTETELTQTGERMFPDGWYTIWVRAMDQEGNYEDYNDDTETVRLYVDNTGPVYMMDPDPMTTEIEPADEAIEVERNGMLSVMAYNEGVRDDDIVTFYYKQARDLNLGASWTMLESMGAGWGVDDSDVNPDETRPYSFDWDLDKTEPALHADLIGEEFHVSIAAEDIVGNDENDQIVHFGVGNYMTFKLVDTMAPLATISRLARVTGNTDDIWWPHEMEVVHARDIDYIESKILGLDADVDHVDFMYYEDGDPENLVLIDGVLTSTANGLTWTLDPNWDLRVLAGKTLHVFAVGYDDVGNVDMEAAMAQAFTLYVDYDTPIVDIITPVDDMQECPYEAAGADSVYLLQFVLDEEYTQYDIWHDSIIWHVKQHEDLTWGTAINFTNNGVFDSETGVWTDYWDLAALTPATGLYDFRLTLQDLAGNMYDAVEEGTVVENVVVDGDDPELAEITRIDNDETGEQIYPAPAPVDITRGDVLTVVATVSDDEAELPDNYETGVTEVLFQARRIGGAWRDIGMWMPPEETVFIEGTASVQWNTTGLDWAEDGEQVEVRVKVKDAACNVTEGPPVMLEINDFKPARARIAGWYVCPIEHGDDPGMYCRVYALAYCDADIDEVQFQYMPEGGDEWIPFGIAGEQAHGTSGIDYLWFSDIELTESFALGDTIMLRAIATDDEDNMDENPPEVMVYVDQYTTGLWAGVWDLMTPTYEEPMLTGPSVKFIAGAGNEERVKVHVNLTDALQTPHVLMVRPAAGRDTCAWADSVFMEREITPGADGSWYGWDPIGGDTCGRYEVFASAMTEEGGLELYRTSLWSYEVTQELGSNGTATVYGYAELDTEQEPTGEHIGAMVNVPSGAGGMAECLFISPIDPPIVDGDQARYLTMLPRTAYFIGYPGTNTRFNEGYPAHVTIQYDDAALIDLFGDAETAAAREPFLTVKAWGNTALTGAETFEWHGRTISMVSVDTAANQISFYVDRFVDTNALALRDPYFAIFAPRASAPVTVSSYKPGSVRYGRWNYTDADPVLTAYLNSPGEAAIRTQSIELWIDDVLWAATASSWDDDARGAGRLEVTRANEEGTIYEVRYYHSYRTEDWLRPGWHTLNIAWEDSTDQGNWYELPAEMPGARFFVDMVAPEIAFHGGFVSNPLLRNVAGYMSPPVMNHMLMVELYDGESGIYMRPDHPEWVWDDDCTDNLPPDPRHAIWQDEAIGGGTPSSDGCWVEMDYGFKYDLWLVHDEDDQGDIDEIEERLLLHSGTADEVLPYCDPPFEMVSRPDTLPAASEFYTPDKRLSVGLPIVGGGMIQDGDILEVVIYSVKSIEQYSDSMVIHAKIDTMMVGGQQVLVYADAYLDMEGQEMHTYDYGLIDYARNMGSKYVEQRFVVDMSAPTVRLVSAPPVPGQPATISIAVQDGGAGVPAEGEMAPTVHLVSPTGEVLEDVEFEHQGGGVWTATIDDGLDFGNYTVSVVASDFAGNAATISVPVRAQNATLTVTDAFIYPNPLNPNDFDGIVHFMLGREAHVTVKVYDFAGDYVTTLANNEHYMAGPVDIAWDGTAGGAELGNGAYLIRVEAEDGKSKKGATIKAVIWRED